MRLAVRDELPSEIDATEIAEESNIFDPNIFFEDESYENSKPSYDEPSITGLEKN